MGGGGPWEERGDPGLARLNVLEVLAQLGEIQATPQGGVREATLPSCWLAEL